MKSSDDERFKFDCKDKGYYRLKLDSQTINKFAFRSGWDKERFSKSIGKIVDEFEMFLDLPNLSFTNPDSQYYDIWKCEDDEIKSEKMWSYIKKGGSQASPLSLALKFRLWNSILLNQPIKTPSIYNSPLEVKPIDRFCKQNIRRF